MATYATRNLGVAFDSKLSFRSHISHVRTPAFYHWKRIQTVKSYISKFMLETLVHRFISSQIDFSNSLSKLQTVQNACARFLTGTKQRDSVKQECHNLRWYPVDRHIKSDCRSAVSSIKLLLLADNIIHQKSDNICTDYVCLQIYTGSSLGTICEVPRSCLKTFGDRSFVSAIPNLWNQLPLSVCLNNSLSSFKNGLKRYYFKQYYMC